MAIEKHHESGLASAQVDGHTYEFEKWGAESALDTLMDLSMLIGKPLASAMGDGDGGALKQDVVTALGNVNEQLGQHRSVALRTITKLATEGVICDGVLIGRRGFDKHYGGRLDHLFRVLGPAVEVQYGDFFAAVGLRKKASLPS